MKRNPAGVPSRDTAIAAGANGITINLTAVIPHDLVDRIARAIAEHTRTIAGVSPPETPGVQTGGKERPASDGLPETGYIRLKEILRLIPVSRSTWYQGVASGKYPAPTKKFGERIAAWDVRDIRALIEGKPPG